MSYHSIPLTAKKHSDFIILLLGVRVYMQTQRQADNVSWSLLLCISFSFNLPLFFIYFHSIRVPIILMNYNLIEEDYSLVSNKAGSHCSCQECNTICHYYTNYIPAVLESSLIIHFIGNFLSFHFKGTFYCWFL